MNNRKTTYNTLIIRELLPPPISCNVTSNIPSTAPCEELKTVPCYIRLTPFVAGLFVLLCLAVSLSFASCEKEVMEELTPMHQMYNESVTLPQATLDSITHFTYKFGGYVGTHPESRQDQYFTPTLQNLRDAAALHGCTIKETTVTTGITVNDEWDGESYLTF